MLRGGEKSMAVKSKTGTTAFSFVILRVDETSSNRMFGYHAQ